MTAAINIQMRPTLLMWVTNAPPGPQKIITEDSKIVTDENGNEIVTE